MFVVPAIVAFAVALAGGRLYLEWAPQRMLDIPNERSSHARPIPRGGGLVIVTGFVAGLVVWLVMGGSLSPRAIGWLAGALLVAGVSFVDDLRSLPALPRLFAHLVATALLTLSAVQERELSIVVALPLVFLYVIALTNVYNFMDGIDGLATTQAVIAGISLAIAGTMVTNPLVTIGGSLLAASALAFLRYNAPPARLFMGDVGSTFFGFSFAGLPLLANIGVGGGRVPVEFGVILMAPFLFDSVVTLVRRVLKGERWYAAHRSHYYQRLVSAGLSHAQVTGLYALLAIVAAGAALADLTAAPPLRLLLIPVGYAPMLAVVVLVWRLEHPEKPNQVSNVVTQGHG